MSGKPYVAMQKCTFFPGDRGSRAGVFLSNLGRSSIKQTFSGNNVYNILDHLMNCWQRDVHFQARPTTVLLTPGIGRISA